MGSVKVLENFSWGPGKVLEKSWIFFSKRVGTLSGTLRVTTKNSVCHNSVLGTQLLREGPPSYNLEYKLSQNPAGKN